MGTPKAFAAVPGLTPAIKSVALAANQAGLAQSYRLVWLTSLAFTGIGVILALMSPNTKQYLTDKVVITLKNDKRGKPRKVEEDV